MLGCCPNGTVTVDWGDGTEPNVIRGSSTGYFNFTPTHNYAKPGNYVITLRVDGEVAFGGINNTNEYSLILRHSSSANAINNVYRNAVQKIEIGNNVTEINNYAFHSCNALTDITISGSVTRIGENAFTYCHALSSVTIQNGVKSISSYAFQYCYGSSSVTIPASVTSIGYGAFYYCYSLLSITFPEGVTSIGGNAFYYCKSLSSVTIPGSVTNIAANTFYGCSSLRFCDFSNHTSIPTLAAYNAFSDVAGDCQILVPATLHGEWKEKTNWIALASKIVPV